MPSFTGVPATRTGAYSSSGVIRATMQTVEQAVCGLPNLSHVGSFRPQLRFYADATTIALTLWYQSLDGPFRRLLPYKVPVVAGWNHVDLGTVTIPEAQLGSQRWTGYFTAYSTASGGEALDIDAVWLMPAERYGYARAAYQHSPGALFAFDSFTGRTAGAALGGTAAELGGTWATSGSTTDFTAADGPADAETITRATTLDSAPRFAVLGSNMTAQEVSVRYRGSAEVGGDRHHGVVARYADASNHLRLSHQSTTSPGDVWLEVVVGGVATVLAEMGSALVVDAWHRVRLIVFASGYGVATWTGAHGQQASVQFQHSALATGGALATGKAGIIDRNGSSFASTRYYDDFYAATPAPEPVVIHAGRSIEFRSDSTLREDASGTYAGPPPQYVGSRFLVPPAGDAGRKSRVAVIARRNDITESADDHIADSTTVTVYVTPRYLCVPR